MSGANFKRETGLELGNILSSGIHSVGLVLGLSIFLF